jgi:hypothetical protein
MTNDDKRPLDTVGETDEEWTALNVKEFTVGKIAQQAKVVAYAYDYKFTPKDSSEEQTKTQEMFYVKIGETVKPTRLNKQTKNAIQKGFKEASWKKLVGKEIVATVESYAGNDFIIWKPQNTVD